MTTYESTFICTPEIPAEKIEELIQKMKGIVETAGGKISVTQQLGRKRLAYPVKKFREGNYVYTELAGPGSMISALENFYKVNDVVIRYLTVQTEKKKVVKPVVTTVAGETPKPATEEGKPNEPNTTIPTNTNEPSAPRAE